MDSVGGCVVTKVKWGFKSHCQGPLFMLWREWWEDGNVVFAKVIYSTDRLFCWHGWR